MQQKQICLSPVKNFKTKVKIFVAKKTCTESKNLAENEQIWKPYKKGRIPRRILLGGAFSTRKVHPPVTLLSPISSIALNCTLRNLIWWFVLLFTKFESFLNSYFIISIFSKMMDKWWKSVKLERPKVFSKWMFRNKIQKITLGVLEVREGGLIAKFKFLTWRRVYRFFHIWKNLLIKSLKNLVCPSLKPNQPK